MTLQDETTVVVPDAVDDAFESIPLPDVTRRGEARRRRVERRRRRRAEILRWSAAATAAVVVIALVVAVWPSSKHHAATSNKTAKAAAAAVKASPPVLMAQQDAKGNAASLILLVPAAKDKGGTVVLIPPGAMAEVASLGLEPVGQALGLGGPQRLEATVENLLGATIGTVALYDDTHLAELLQPAGALSVRIDKRVEQVDGKGQVNVLYEPGLQQVQPADAPVLLATKGDGSDLDRLVRHQKFVEAWLARLKTLPAAIPAQPPALHAAVAALLKGPVSTQVLPVHSLGTTGDGELYQVDQAELRNVVAAVFPGPRPGAGVRPRIQILNGTGAVGLAQRVADALVPAGVEVKLTGNAGRLDYLETQIVFYNRKDQAVAERVQKALGAGRLVLSRNPIDVVDVTVIVGRDYQPQ
jgi:hypothetical protein